MSVSHSKARWIGFSLAVIGTLLFSLKSIFIKYLYQQGLDADSVLVFRMLLALPIYIAVLLWLVSRSDNLAKLDAKLVRFIFALGFLGYYLASLLDLMGLEQITAQLERLSLFTYPFMIAVIGFLFFNEKISKQLVVSLVMTYLGLILVMFEELSLTGNNVMLGVTLVLGSALSFSVYVLFSKPLIKQLGSSLFTAIAMIASSCFGIMHGMIFLDFAALTMTMQAWFWLLMLVIFSTVIPSFMMTEAINRIGPAETGVVGMLGPIFTIVLAVYLLNEPFSPNIALGGVLILAGVFSLVRKQHQRS